MPAGATGFSAGDGKAGNVGFASGAWVTMVSSAVVAQSAGDLLNPFLIDDSSFRWVRVPFGMRRMYVRGFADWADLTVVNTSPVIRVFGTDRDPTDGVSTNATTEMMRLDTADWNGAGVTLTYAANGTGLHTDLTRFYTDVVPTTMTNAGGYCVEGCMFVGIAVATAADLGLAANGIEALFLP